jgi:hypothetical protein
VALICDEFHYLASRNVIKQIATHRAAGLDVMAGLQFFSQLGAGAESAAITDEIRKGVLNLLQSRFLFRLGDPDDAETVTRVAMAVYSTMIRGDDPSARAHMRVTPEVILNLPRYHCLASWIVDDQRASSFMLQTKPMQDKSALGWAKVHREVQQAQVGDYPEKMAGTLRRKLNVSAPPLADRDVEIAAAPRTGHVGLRDITAGGPPSDRTPGRAGLSASSEPALPAIPDSMPAPEPATEGVAPSRRPPRRLAPAPIVRSTLMCRASSLRTPTSRAPTSTNATRPPSRIAARCSRCSAGPRAATTRNGTEAASCPPRCANWPSSTASTSSAAR